MIRRRALTPPSSQAVPGVHPTRRRASRRESSERVRFSIRGREVDGWTLNQSPGGLRAILEEPLELGDEIEVHVGAADARPGRIVWIQDEPDGAIVGVAYLDVEGGEGEPPRSEMPDDLDQATDDGTGV
ncbi:MAG TPA: PilZ domain-containing protein [Candidatus Nanopelagicales bacterium]|nr:PilZ domain-containing protein [Candidatus Nanopelagicales bacterium]